MNRVRAIATLAFIGLLAGAGCASPLVVDETTSGDRTYPSQFPRITPAPVGAPKPVFSLLPLTDDEAWAMLIPFDPASISYPSLAAIARDADAVVIASPGELVQGPTFVDKYGNDIYLASLTLDVERVIRGMVNTRRPGTLTLWIPLGVSTSGYDYAEYFDNLAASAPSGRAIFHLKNMAEWARKVGAPLDDPQADPYAYQILGGQGFLREIDGLAEPPLLSADALATMAGTWQLGLQGDPFDEVVHTLDAIAMEHP